METMACQLPLRAEAPPLRVGVGGVIRIGTSRISFDLLVEQYENGMTPEDLVRAYDTLELTDVYAAIGYYLKHREEVQADLKRRTDEAGQLRARIEQGRPHAIRSFASGGIEHYEPGRPRCERAGKGARPCDGRACSFFRVSVESVMPNHFPAINFLARSRRSQRGRNMVGRNIIGRQTRGVLLEPSAVRLLLFYSIQRNCVSGFSTNSRITSGHLAQVVW
jgi:uncharacterized protein (DUF433 family)